MGLTGNSVLVKYLIFAFNLLFVIFGIVLISVGAAVKAKYHEYELFLDDKFFSVPALLIAIGVIIFVVAFFGCCGSVKENYCMVLTFSLLLVVIFILEFSAGIAGYVLRDNAETFLESKLKESINNYKQSNSTAKVWDVMQTNFNCCGINKPEDWDREYHDTNGTLPASCCHTEYGLWGGEPCSTASPYRNKEGCLPKLGAYVADHAAMLGGVGIGIAVIQFLGMVMACNLARTIKKSYESV
ncbi:CD63 antigen-like [Bacillus rossius redtenbacheri]|uniref:CD63 antigen-like n=1 Tax=Bacillus rossius redtenbacheri TaxID=93214 RepID=UPI002FDDFF5C